MPECVALLLLIVELSGSNLSWTIRYPTTFMVLLTPFRQNLRSILNQVMTASIVFVDYALLIPSFEPIHSDLIEAPLNEPKINKQNRICPFTFTFH
jgi:hypothetical protein